MPGGAPGFTTQVLHTRIQCPGEAEKPILTAGTSFTCHGQIWCASLLYQPLWPRSSSRAYGDTAATCTTAVLPINHMRCWLVLSLNMMGLCTKAQSCKHLHWLVWPPLSRNACAILGRLMQLWCLDSTLYAQTKLYRQPVQFGLQF